MAELGVWSVYEGGLSVMWAMVSTHSSIDWQKEKSC
jgi:hypothetical protein